MTHFTFYMMTSSLKNCCIIDIFFTGTWCTGSTLYFRTYNSYITDHHTKHHTDITITTHITTSATEHINDELTIFIHIVYILEDGYSYQDEHSFRTSLITWRLSHLDYFFIPSWKEVVQLTDSSSSCTFVPVLQILYDL